MLHSLAHSKISKQSQQVVYNNCLDVDIPNILHLHLSFFFPYTTCDSQLQLLSIPTRKIKAKVPLNYKTILTISNFPMTVANAPRNSLPCKLAAICANFQAVAEFLCFTVLTHKPQKGHVNWSCANLECLKVQAEVSPKTIKNLKAREFNMLVGFSCQALRRQ